MIPLGIVLGFVIGTLIVLLARKPVFAAPFEPRWHAGLDARTSLNRRPVGIALGLRREHLGFNVVADPLALLRDTMMIDFQLSLWPTVETWELTAGWRHENDVVGAGRRYDERAVVGVNISVPYTSSFRIMFGAEAVVSVIRHGGGLRRDVLPLTASDMGLGAEILFHLRCDFTGRL